MVDINYQVNVLFKNVCSSFFDNNCDLKSLIVEENTE